MAKNPANDIGAVIALSIGKTRFGYGRIGDNLAMQVFDLVTIGIMPASSVLEYPVAFWSSFLFDGFKNGRWKKIGHIPFKKRADSFAPPFGIDNSHIQEGHYLISHKRRLLPATAKDIAGLEPEVFRDADDMATEIRRRVKRKPIRVIDEGRG